MTDMCHFIDSCGVFPTYVYGIRVRSSLSIVPVLSGSGGFVAGVAIAALAVTLIIIIRYR